MTILHVYDEADAMAGRYVEMLMQATDAMMRQGSLFDEPLDMYACSDVHRCRQLVDERRPDILHLHGGTAPFTLPPGLRLVVTPHGSMPGPVRAYVVVARSPHEAETLGALFPRVETVRNPLITRSVTPADCARQMGAIYRRVMDSNVLQLMDTDTRRLLTAALAVATYGDARWLPSTFHVSAAGAHYRQLYIYAALEGVLPMVRQGLTMLGINAPEPDAKVDDSYLPEDYAQPAPMSVATVSELVADISHHGPSLLRLSELARALHSSTIDEEQLQQTLQQEGLLTLLAALLPLLSEQLLLTEGFMPCQPVEGPAAQQLRAQLASRQDI